MDNNIVFNIGICDDSENWCKSIFESCRSFFVDKDAVLNISIFNSGESVICEKNFEMDVLFLDVEMDSMDGLAVMKKVEGMPNIHNIIFVSSHSEAVWNSFGFKTKGFVTKPFLDKDIWDKLNDIYIHKTTNSVIKFNDFNGAIYLKKSEIEYLKANANYVTIFTENKVYTITCILKECEKILGGIPFVRIHKSYLINFEHVSNISGGFVYLNNGQILNIGRSYREQVKKDYKDYLLRELHL